MATEKEHTTYKHRPFRPRILWTVIKAADLVPMTIFFLALFVIASVILTVYEPEFSGPMDAGWFLFTVISTIGLGDYTCETLIGRGCCVILSLYSIIYIALITGTLVNYCNQRIQTGQTGTIAHLLDQLEHVHEMSHEELVDLANRVKNLR